MKVAVLTFLLVSLEQLTSNVESTGVFIGDCYEKWGDCSGWSTWGTPKFKLLCEDGCKALGTFGGVCVVTPNKACQQSSKIFQCQCSNYCYRSNPVTSNGKQ